MKLKSANLVRTATTSFLFAAHLQTARPAEGGAPTVDSAVEMAGPAANDQEQFFDQTVGLSNGDTLTGRLESFDSENGLSWHHPDVEGLINFEADEVKEVHLRRSKDEQEASGNIWKIYLANGDVIEGRLTALTKDTVVIENSLAGGLSFPRRFVRILNPVFQSQTPVYLGFNEDDKWIIGEVDTPDLEGGPWTYKNHAYYAFKAASLAKNIGLPDQVSVRFTLAWKGALSLAIGLYTDSLEPISLAEKQNEPSFGGFYSMAIYDQGAVLRGINQTDPIKQLGQVYLQNLAQKKFAEIEILVHKEGKAILLKVDGETVHVWREPDEFMGEGTGLRFVHQGRGALRISDLEIRHWDGQLESVPNLETSAIQDAVWITENRKLLGDVVSMDENSLLFKANSSAEPEPVPLENIQRILLKRIESPELLSGETASQLFGGKEEQMTVRLDRITEDAAVGTYPGAGEISVPLSQLSRIKIR